MDHKKTTAFRSTIYPDVSLTIKKQSYGRRMEILRRMAAEKVEGSEVGNISATLIAWHEFVVDFDGFTLDGQKPSVDEFFLDGPEDLVDEVSAELYSILEKKRATDESDERIIEAARRQIDQAEKRIAERKNSGPQSSTPTSAGAGTRTAASASAPEMTPDEFELSAIATGTPV